MISKGPLMASNFARVGVVMATKDRYIAYAREAVLQSGLCWDLLDESALRDLRTYDCIVLMGEGQLGLAERTLLLRWVEEGGRLVCVGGPWGLESELEVVPHEARYPARSRLHPLEEGRTLWPLEAGSLPVFGGTYCYSKGCAGLVTLDDEFVGVGFRKFGAGKITLASFDFGQSLCRIQTGYAVDGDGIGPNDGSATFHDGVPRAEDGIALDFSLDREVSEEGGTPFFAQPYAELLKELVFAVIIRDATETGKAIAMLSPWPDESEGCAVLAVECTEFDADQVFALKQVMDHSAVPACWLVAPPGYALDVFRMIRRWDDEVGLLFSPGGPGGWTGERMRSQANIILRSAAQQALTAASTLDGQARGRTLFIEMCAEAGPRLNLSRGGRQLGTAGFPFGSCRPFLVPVGSTSLVYDQPTHFYLDSPRLSVSTMHAIVRQVALRNGCFVASLSSQYPLDHRGVLTLRQIFMLARQYNLTWRLPHQIVQFERARRHVQVNYRGGALMELTSDHGIQGLTVLVGAQGMVQPLADGVRGNPRRVRRYGIDFQSMAIDLAARRPQMIGLGLDLGERAA